MHTLGNYLAIPNGYLPPAELPGHFECMVYACDIIDSHQPGYVYLQISHILRKTDRGCYVAQKAENRTKEPVCLVWTKKYDPQIHRQKLFWMCMNEDIQNNATVQYLMIPAAEFHGPAMNGMYNSYIKELYKPLCRSVVNFDIVPCYRCFHWPPQSRDWPTRYRFHGWPDATTIDRVVSNGCDVVGAVHPLCKRDEWMSKHQWRLSFSRAEVTLLNTWTPVPVSYTHLTLPTKRIV